MNNLESKLNTLRQANAWSAEQKNAVKNRVFAVVRAEAAPAVAPSPVWFRVSNLISRPLTAGTAVFALLASGWSATVSAAAGSLPGDVLYPVKRVGESAQLTLASLDRRAVLHTEFASRRLEEAEQLQAATEQTEEVRALAVQALQEYQGELQAAASDIALLSTEDAPAALEVATEVQQTVEQLTTITASPTETVEAVEQTEQVQQVAGQITNSIIKSVVDVHEYSTTETSERRLKEMFVKRLSSLETRRTFNLHRLDVIQERLTANASLAEVAELPTEDDFKRLRFAIESALNQVPEAMSLFANSGYRQAFRNVEGIEAELLAVERNIAEIEIELTNLLRQAQTGGVQTQGVSGDQEVGKELL